MFHFQYKKVRHIAFYSMTAITLLYLNFYVQEAFSAFRKPDDCGKMVKLSKEKRIKRADIAFRARVTENTCECTTSGAARCLIRLKPLKNYKNSNMDKVYTLEQTYKLDFGCSRDYIKSLEETGGEQDYFLVKDGDNFKSTGTYVCSSNL